MLKVFRGPSFASLSFAGLSFELCYESESSIKSSNTEST